MNYSQEIFHILHYLKHDPSTSLFFFTISPCNLKFLVIPAGLTVRILIIPSLVSPLIFFSVILYTLKNNQLYLKILLRLPHEFQ